MKSAVPYFIKLLSQVEEGSELACTTPLELEAGDKYYSLQEPNTCIVVCDGIFATTLTCEKKENFIYNFIPYIWERGIEVVPKVRSICIFPFGSKK